MGFRFELPRIFDFGTFSGRRGRPALPLARPASLAFCYGEPHASGGVLGQFLATGTEQTEAKRSLTSSRRTIITSSQALIPTATNFTTRSSSTRLTGWSSKLPIRTRNMLFTTMVERIAHDIVPVLPDNGKYDR